MTKIKIVVTHYAQRITTIFDYISVKDVIINYNHLYFNLISRLSKPILPHHTPHTVWPCLICRILSQHRLLVIKKSMKLIASRSLDKLKFRSLDKRLWFVRLFQSSYFLETMYCHLSLV